MTQMIDFGERAQRARDDRDNRALRAGLAATLADEAARDATPLPAGMEARIWEQVERRVAAGSGARRWRRWQCVLPVAATVLAAMVVAVLYVGRVGNGVAEWPEAGVKGSGIKSAGSAVSAARLTTLRYAVVDGSAGVRPGDGETRVQVGQAIVFSVEAEGVDAQHAVEVALDYVAPDGETGKVVSGYQVRAAREILTGERGYLAFSPSQPGIYRFTAKDGTHESGVAVRVVE